MGFPLVNLLCITKLGIVDPPRIGEALLERAPQLVRLRKASSPKEAYHQKGPVYEFASGIGAWGMTRSSQANAWLRGSDAARSASDTSMVTCDLAL